MEIVAPKSWSDWLTPSETSRRSLIADPGGAPVGSLDFSQPVATQIAIGPEGGFTDTEIATATAAGWQPVALGDRILRVETAAIALTAAVALR
jgi:16S rRNA (uracil1498-N3)-methyltransferase